MDAGASDKNYTLASSATASKPPPESPEGVRVRSLVIFSFWAVVVFLGLPVWWWTTSIYRARLPLRQMTDWADGKVQPLSLLRLKTSNNRFLGMQTYIPSANRH